MSQNPAPPRRSPLYPVLVIAVICTVIGITACTANSSPVPSSNSAVPPTHARSFAVVQIAKSTATQAAPPTNLPAPIILTTALLTDPPISSPAPTTPQADSQISAPLVYAEILADTPTPEYAAPVAEDAYTYEAAAPSYGGNKYILVDISEQNMYVYEGDVLVYNFVSSTGMNNATRAGYFSVLDKIPNAYGATWDIWMPNWLGIYWAGSLENGIHALPILPNGATLWAGYLGVPLSYGCVVLGSYEAQVLFDWAEVGTPVEIRW